ncbi:MAG TPA: aminodeoxychorismate synthase component I [Methylovorus sp.]|nr:aminodeoxychorismate synthase component I [Methylovorus sp.]
MLKHAIPYSPDSAALFARIAHEPWAVFLDSGKPGSFYGRYDILAARPYIRITTTDGVTTVADDTGSQVYHEDAFAVLNRILASAATPSGELPFEGGAIGYFGYDLGRALETLPTLAEDAEHIPQMQLGIYDWALVVDHREQAAWLVSHQRHPSTTPAWDVLCQLFAAPWTEETQPFKVNSPLQSNLDEPAYGRAFDRIKRYIHEGDCYQVNLAQRFSVTAQGDGWQAYRYLRTHSPAPFMAYLNFPQLQILSGSPERFLQVNHGHVETRPIKGTRPRAEDPVEDASNAHDLQHSLKDRAENLMIVDLLRNDIGKNCAVGSVRADKLFALESFSNVHHLVSTVSGELSPGTTAVDLLRGSFPGGSITGAPKLRAMEIIEELEPHRRGVYCGAIGYIGFDGNMDTNIAIRTAVYSDNCLRFWAGGGIVADSVMEKEYRETWDKASSMLQLVAHFQKAG